MNEKYDIVGDIHGHANKLQRLLQRLGYEERDGIYRHASRQLVFVGDLIDRGPEIRRTLQIVRAMVDAGTARAVMGNHELNALLYHTKGSDGELAATSHREEYCPASGNAGPDCAIRPDRMERLDELDAENCHFGWTWARAELCTLHGTTLPSRPMGPAIPWLKSLLQKPEDAGLRRAVP